MVFFSYSAVIGKLAGRGCWFLLLLATFTCTW